MNRNESAALDQHITGNYGEDSVPDGWGDDLPNVTIDEFDEVVKRADELDEVVERAAELAANERAAELAAKEAEEDEAYARQAEEEDAVSADCLRKIGAAFELLATLHSDDGFTVLTDAAEAAETLARIIDSHDVE